MDKLDKLFELQRTLDGKLGSAGGGDCSREEWLQRKSLALITEVGEFLEETHYKWWKTQGPVDEEALREELIDIGHFFLSMVLTTGMDADEFFARYAKKNQVNHARQNSPEYRPDLFDGDDPA